MKPGRPSETAGRIAVNAVAAALDPELRRLVADPDEPFSAWFAEEHSPQSRQQLALWRSGAPMMRKLSDAIEPGGALFVLARKLWIEDRVRRALAAGAAQVAVIGAGYDTLCLRLAPAFPNVRFVELDHPATQQVKRRVLETHAALPASLALAPLDLAEQAPGAALGEAAWDRARAAVVVAEGVLMYIEERPLDAVFASLAESLAPGSRFIFTLMDRGKLQQAGSATARTATLLAASGEPLRSSLEPAALPEFLSARGFRLVETADAGALRRDYLEPRGVERALSEGEFLVEAERA
jgi:methyltransferase (TIGR00027 family)